jgi:hypothetical protein
VEAGFRKESDRILGIFVKVSIEYSLVHEICIAAVKRRDFNRLLLRAGASPFSGALTGIFKSSVALKREEYHTSP